MFSSSEMFSLALVPIWMKNASAARSPPSLSHSHTQKTFFTEYRDAQRCPVSLIMVLDSLSGLDSGSCEKKNPDGVKTASIRLIITF